MEDRLDVERGAQRGAEEAHALVAALLDPVAQVVQVGRHHVALGVQRQVFQPRTDLRRALAGGTQARCLDRQHADRGEHVLAVDHPQRERHVVAGGGAYRLVVVEDGEAGLLRIVVDAAAGARGADAEHVVVVQHQLGQEQVVHLLHGVGGGLGVVGLGGGVAGEEVEGRVLVAHVGEHRIADLHGHRQDGDRLVRDEARRYVTSRIHHDPDTHVAPTPRSVASNVPQLRCICMWQSGMAGIAGMPGFSFAPPRHARAAASAPAQAQCHNPRISPYRVNCRVW